MKKFFLLLSFAFLSCTPIKAQIYDTSCPVTSSVLGGWAQTMNPLNGHLKAYLCVDAQGNVSNAPPSNAQPGTNISSIGNALNVKSFGAIGNGKFFIDGVSNAVNNQLTSATAAFTINDIGQNVVCVATPLTATAAIKINATIASFVTPSAVTYSGANAGVFSSMYCSFTNPLDSAAILAAFNACKSIFNGDNGATATTQNPACNIYLPFGIYGLGNTLDNLISSGNEGCVGIIGDGPTKTLIIPTGSFTTAGRTGLLINGRCIGNYYKDFSFELASIPFSAGVSSAFVSVIGSSAFIDNIAVFDGCVSSGTLYGLFSGGGTAETWIHPVVVSSGNCGGTNGGLQLQNVSQATIYNPFLSNTQQNLQINNASSGSNGSGIAIYGGVIDEGSVTSVTASQDVWFNGVTLTGGTNCLSVDSTSYIWLTGGYCGTFGGNTGSGPTVSSGGVLNMTQVHVNAVNAGSSCYISAAYGGIVDDGTNRCTTSGGGVVYVSGNFINRTSLTHAESDGFQSGTIAAAVVKAFTIDQPIAISAMTWQPSNTPACTAGSLPTISITDGTVTLTTSGSDTFGTNNTVSHTFDNKTDVILNPTGAVGTVITIKVASAGTCGTPPTNVNLSAFWSATAPTL